MEHRDLPAPGSVLAILGGARRPPKGRQAVAGRPRRKTLDGLPQQEAEGYVRAHQEHSGHFWRAETPSPPFPSTDHLSLLGGIVTTSTRRTSTTAGSQESVPAGPVAPTAGAACRLRPVPVGAVEITGGFFSRQRQVNGKVGIPSGRERLEQPATWTTFASPRVTSRGGPRAGVHGLRRVQVARGGSLGVRPAAGGGCWSGSARSAPSWQPRSARRLPRLGRAGPREGRALHGPALEPRALLRRTPLPGRRRARLCGERGLSASRRGRPPRGHLRRDRNHESTDIPSSRSPWSSCSAKPASATTSSLPAASWTPAATVYGPPRPGADVLSDRVPVRERHRGGTRCPGRVPGAGAADVAAETGDADLLAALDRQWPPWSEKTYITGGLGARWDSRRSATRTSCHPIARTPRPAPPSAASTGPGACCSQRAIRGTPT